MHTSIMTCANIRATSVCSKSVSFRNQAPGILILSCMIYQRRTPNHFTTARSIVNKRLELVARYNPDFRLYVYIRNLSTEANKGKKMAGCCLVDIVYGPGGFTSQSFYINGYGVTGISDDCNINRLLIAKREDCVDTDAM